MIKEQIVRYIDSNSDRFTEISDKIWDLAETGLQEHQSADYLTSVFEEAGFEIDRRIADMPTAFTATYGTKKPVIAILGEFDALPGLSQEPVPYRKSVKEGASGQGCQHNLLGGAGLAAAFALMEQIKTGELGGTVRYYGCPAEESYNAKGWMAVNGYFEDVDIGLTWHPMSYNAIWRFSTNAINTVMFKFHGQEAHAAGDPYNGRSALDAVELMNVGVNYLREHMIPDARIHYIISNGGGAPNVVPPFAESYYFVRAPKREQVDELYQRVIKVAKGAALMTETELEIDFLSGTYNTRENKIIGEVILDNMKNIGPVKWNEEEKSFAREMRKTLSENAFEGIRRLAPAEHRDEIEDVIKQPLCERILPPMGENVVLSGSTDVADVSWNVPVAQFSVATQIMGSPGHSWQNVSCGRMSIGHKGMIMAAKVLATSACDLMMKKELREKAWKEFNEISSKTPYQSPFPQGHKPPFHRLKPDILQYPSVS